MAGAPAPLRHFSRPTGPVCWEVDLFDEAHRLGLGTILLESGLSWSWHDQDGPLKRLAAATAPDLVADVGWRNADGYGKLIALYAVDAGAVADLAADLESAVHSFSMRESGPIRAIVIQVGDAEHEHAFVPHEPVAAVAALLATLVTRREEYEIVPYRRLYTAALEIQLGVDGGSRPAAVRGGGGNPPPVSRPDGLQI